MTPPRPAGRCRFRAAKTGRSVRDVIGRAEQPGTLFDVGRPTVEDLAKKAKPLKGDAITIKRGTTGADYLTARIARDHPVILDRMKTGEFKSARRDRRSAGRLRRSVNY